MPEVATTVRALLDRARGALGAAGLPDPADEALRLWAGLRREPTGSALVARDAEVSEVEACRFEQAVARRVAGEPLAYVVGTTGFRHLELVVDRRALIPRPETEGLVELVLTRQPMGRVADIGTGTGCIAMALATEGRYSEVHAVDLSREALQLARSNAAAVGAVVRFHEGDLLAPLAGLALDAVVSNPPYLTDREYVELDPSVRDWEPKGALVGGGDGMEHTHRLLDDGRGVVRTGGWIFLEVDCNRAEDGAALARRFGWGAVEVHRDLFGRDRYLVARRSEG